MALKASTRTALQTERQNYAAIVRRALSEYEEALERLADAVEATGQVTINTSVDLGSIPVWKRLLSCIPLIGRFVRVPTAGLTVSASELQGQWVDKVSAAMREVSAAEAYLIHLCYNDLDFEVTNVVTSVYTKVK